MIVNKNFFYQRTKTFQFWATNMLYTSNESWNYVEFKFIMKKYDLILENGKKSIFLIFASKTRLIRYLREPISLNCTNKSQKWLYQGLVEASTWKVTKGELIISTQSKTAADLLNMGPSCPPTPNWNKINSVSCFHGLRPG